MINSKSLGLFLICTILVLFMPEVGHYFKPENLKMSWVFPVASPGPEKPGFSVSIFSLILLLCFGFLMFTFDPQRFFGFGKFEASQPRDRWEFPWWFFLASASFLFWWWIHWAEPQQYASIVPYAFTPLWWSLIVMLDGWVYGLSDGVSFGTYHPFLFYGVTNLFSMVMWLEHDYLQTFAELNWWYPITDPHFPRLCHFVAFGTAVPAVVEFYCLLQLCPSFAKRHHNGYHFTKPLGLFEPSDYSLLGLVVFCCLLSIGYGYFASPLFWWMELGPVLLYGAALVHQRSTFSALSRICLFADWSTFVVSAWAGGITGALYEFFNAGTGVRSVQAQTLNPNFWIFEIPYVQVLHLGQMPLLGYAGYLVLGVALWESWILFLSIFSFQFHPLIQSKFLK